MTAVRRLPPRGLTEAQRRLVQRHRAGVARLAATLAARQGVAPTGIMLLLVDPSGRVGRALAHALPGSTIGPIVLPGRAAEVDGWVARLVAYGPVWDLRGDAVGINVIVIDGDDAMAVMRV